MLSKQLLCDSVTKPAKREQLLTFKVQPPSRKAYVLPLQKLCKINAKA